MKERKLWHSYQECYQQAIDKTAKPHAPWYVIPADNKKAARLLVANILLNELKKYKDIQEPELSEEIKTNLENFQTRTRKRTMRKLVVIALLFSVVNVIAQQEDEKQIKKIYDTSLTAPQAYEWLNYLSNQIGGRLSGYVQAQEAVEYTKRQLDSLGLDRVWLQPVMVPKWVRGTPEYAYFETKPGHTTNVPICALGGSVATKEGGLKANIIEVQGLEELEKLGRAKIEGKIVFYNRPMNPTLISTFSSYGGCVDQRYSGAAEAGKYGAAGVIVRSMNLRLDDYPHTGSMSYGETPVENRIPAAAISTNAAELLSTTLKLNPNVKFYFNQNCKQYN